MLIVNEMALRESAFTGNVARGIDRSALAECHNNLLYYSRDVIESKEGARVHCRRPAFFPPTG